MFVFLHNTEGQNAKIATGVSQLLRTCFSLLSKYKENELAVAVISL